MQGPGAPGKPSLCRRHQLWSRGRHERSGFCRAFPTTSQPGALRAELRHPRPQHLRLCRPSRTPAQRDSVTEPSGPRPNPPGRRALDFAGHHPEHVLWSCAPGLLADPYPEPHGAGPLEEPHCPSGGDRDPPGLHLQPCSRPRTPGGLRYPGWAREAAGGRSGPLARLHPWGLGSPRGGGDSRGGHIQRVQRCRTSGEEESTAEPWSSGSSAVLQRTNVRRKGPAQSQAAGPETAGSRPWPDTGARPPGGWGPRPGARLLLWGDQVLVSMPGPPVREVEGVGVCVLGHVSTLWVPSRSVHGGVSLPAGAFTPSCSLDNNLGWGDLGEENYILARGG